MTKSILYYRLKRLEIQFNTPRTKFVGSTIAYIQGRISQLEAIHEEKKINEEYKYTQNNNIGGRTYFINNVDLDLTSPIILNSIHNRLSHALRTGLSNNSDVHVRFVYLVDGIYTSKCFNSFKLIDFDTFRTTVRRYIDITTSPHPNYLFTVNKIIIRIIREPSGGCNSSSHMKKTKKGESIVIQPRASNNNCFFECVSDMIDLGDIKKNRYNTCRAKFDILPNTMISISKAIEIFTKYRKSGASIRITSPTGEKFCVGISPYREIYLNNDHYEIRDIRKKNKCPDCLKIYYNEHKCNNKRISYVNSKIFKKDKDNRRYLLCNSKTEPNNGNNMVLHYDIETYRYTSEGVDLHETHRPYIVGWVFKDRYKILTGDDCIEKFVDMLIALPSETYINAFNGSNFDHYFIFKEFIKRNIIPKKNIINNGSIISFEYNNFKLFDLARHLPIDKLGNLLESFDCYTRKGDFNHDLACRWEDMSENLRHECVSYLESDVLGLKELYEKINNDIFTKHGKNISSYISTSSLTFDLWKKNISGKYLIELPNIKEEVYYREAIRGGRTYKSKHEFKSVQYDDFTAGNCSYDEIKDYIVDCDVVSLYPSAMANFEYPVGCSQPLKEDEFEMKGKIGIYDIDYKANKNLAHSIGGRRDENGLKWDLKDSSGVYTSVDIEDMINCGYEVKIKSGFYWNDTAPIFKDYINEQFANKNYEAKMGRKKGAAYSIAKLFMNAIYGKMIQRPIYTVTNFIENNTEYWNFWGKNYISDIEEVGDKWVISGTPRNPSSLERCITKPTHLGALVLAYSRRIMLNYMKEANPHFDSTDKIKQMQNDIYYTDTDSLQMHALNVKNIKRFGGDSLGDLSDDLGGCKIIRGVWIAPKLYMLVYITKDSDKLHYHMRGKGLNKKDLTQEKFELMNKGFPETSIRPFSMKKMHINRNSKQQTIEQFSIIHYSEEKDKSRLTRTVNTIPWDGRRFIGNDSLPHQ